VAAVGSLSAPAGRAELQFGFAGEPSSRAFVARRSCQDFAVCKSRKNAYGETEWLTPPHLDRRQPRVNTFHHPEKLLYDDEEEDDQSGAA
jgi:hypothetical protein